MSALDGQVALVTGSSRGIGAAIAREFLAAGIADDGGKVITVTADVTDSGQVEAMRRHVEDALGPVDILVANAGGSFTPPAPLVGFTAGRRANARSPIPYAAAKAGIALLTQDVAEQAGPFGIRANCIAPETILNEGNRERIPAEQQAALAGWHPLKRLGTPAGSDRPATPARCDRPATAARSDQLAAPTTLTKLRKEETVMAPNPAAMRRRAAIMRAVNVPMRAVLSLPVATPLSANLMLISYTGRKTGKAYRQPVSYVRDGDVLLTPGGGRWTLNLTDGRPVRIRLRGREVAVWPELVGDAAEVERLFGVIATKNPRAGRFIPIPRRPDGRLDPGVLDTALRRGFCIVRWHLGPQDAQDPQDPQKP